MHGIDASAENVAAATAHARIDPDIEERTTYRQVLVEELAAELEEAATLALHAKPDVETSGSRVQPVESSMFDVVVSSEVIEHVNEPEAFVDAAARCARPGAAVVLTTIDRSALSYLGAIFAAEQLAGIVPPGTHDYSKFVRPEELSAWMLQAGLKPQAPVPVFYNPITGNWWSHGSKVVMQYAMIATKPTAVRT